MATFEQRIQKLEELLELDDGPSLEAQLQTAKEHARERHRLGLPRPEPPEADDPLAQRLRAAHDRANGLRAWTAKGAGADDGQR